MEPLVLSHHDEEEDDVSEVVQPGEEGAHQALGQRVGDHQGKLEEEGLAGHEANGALDYWDRRNL